MKAFFGGLMLLVAVLATVSCEKVIDVDLNTEDPKYVIEGEVLAGDTIHRVKITRSLNFDENQDFPTVDNAVVTVTDNLGNSATFTSIGNGMYELSGYPGVEGRVYTLTVAVDGQTFVASSAIPGLVEIDSLYIEEFPFGQDTFRTLVPARYDPASIANHYLLKVKRNGEFEEGLFLQNDQFTDGNYSVEPLFLEELTHGDTVEVAMYGVDKPVWSYFNQLYVNTASSATPANPESNFSGGCLGYFSARTASVKSVIYP